MIEALYSGMVELKMRLNNFWSAAQLFVDEIDTGLLSTEFKTFGSNNNVIHYIAYYHISDISRIRRYM